MTIMNTKEKLKLYWQMHRIRAVEEEIALRYPLGKMRCPVHLSIGQEVIPSIFAEAISTTDFAVSTHRGHAHYLAKGGDLKAMVAEIYGKASGCAKGKGGSMHLIDLSVNFMGTSAIVGNSIPVGVGLALSAQLKGTDQISSVFLGDGAIEEGVFYESIKRIKEDSKKHNHKEMCFYLTLGT
jgi:pyruvate dehydrogenase E1 component alpha subunit